MVEAVYARLDEFLQRKELKPFNPYLSVGSICSPQLFGPYRRPPGPPPTGPAVP